MDERLAEELEALCSIFGSSLKVDSSCQDYQAAVIYTDNKDGAWNVKFELPFGYPTEASPSFSLSFHTKLDGNKKKCLVAEISQTIDDGAGDVILFSCIQLIIGFMSDVSLQGDTCTTVPDFAYTSGDHPSPESQQENDRSLGSNFISVREKSSALETSAADTNSNLKIFDQHGKPVSLTDYNPDSAIEVIHGPITTYSRSSFQAHLAAVRNLEQVSRFREEVLRDKKVARATHNIFAYRFTCPNGTGIVYHDCDDDGESAAGQYPVYVSSIRQSRTRLGKFCKYRWWNISLHGHQTSVSYSRHPRTLLS